MNQNARELLRLARLEVVAPNSSKNGLSIPENFDIWKEYKQPNIKVYSGSNDWEASPTCFMLLKSNHRGESNRLWVELNPPDGCDDFGYLTDSEKSNGLTDKAKEKLIKEQGDVFLELWEDSARDLHESSYDSAKGLPSSLNAWADALKNTEALHKYVSMSGSDKTSWKKTNLLNKKEASMNNDFTALDSLLRVAHSIYRQGKIDEAEGEIAENGTEDKADETQGEPMVKMMDDLALELKDIQSDGKVTTSEVIGLFDNMIEMITFLVQAKPPSKPRKTGKPKGTLEESTTVDDKAARAEKKTDMATSDAPDKEEVVEDLEKTGPDKPKAKAKKKKKQKLSSIVDRIVTSASVRYFIDPSKKNTEHYVAMDVDTTFYTGRVGVRKGNTFIKLVAVPFRSQMRYDEMLEKGKLKELSRNKFVNQVADETHMDVDIKKLYQS